MTLIEFLDFIKQYPSLFSEILYCGEGLPQVLVGNKHYYFTLKPDLIIYKSYDEYAEEGRQFKPQAQEKIKKMKVLDIIKNDFGYEGYNWQIELEGKL